MPRQPGLSVRLRLTLSYAGFLMVAGGLLIKTPGVEDRRRAELQLTPLARDLLGKLSRAHLQELEVMEPALTRALGRLDKVRRKAAGA